MTCKINVSLLASEQGFWNRESGIVHHHKENGANITGSINIKLLIVLAKQIRELHLMLLM